MAMARRDAPMAISVLASVDREDDGFSEGVEVMVTEVVIPKMAIGVLNVVEGEVEGEGEELRAAVEDVVEKEVCSTTLFGDDVEVEGDGEVDGFAVVTAAALDDVVAELLPPEM